MLQLTKKPSRCQGIWGQTVSLGLCERTHMRDPIWHLSLLSHQRHNRMLRNRNFHARTLTRTWIRRQLRKWLQAAQPKSYKPADKTEQQEAITDFTQERCRCCLGGTERNVFWGVGEFCNRTENTIEPERGRLTEENLFTLRMKAWRTEVLSHRLRRTPSMSPAELGNTNKLKHGT